MDPQIVAAIIITVGGLIAATGGGIKWYLDRRDKRRPGAALRQEKREAHDALLSASEDFQRAEERWRVYLTRIRNGENVLTPDPGMPSTDPSRDALERVRAVGSNESIQAAQAWFDAAVGLRLATALYSNGGSDEERKAAAAAAAELKQRRISYLEATRSDLGVGA